MSPFTVGIEQAVLDDLQRRLANTRWAADPGNADWSYGANGAYLRELLTHWQTAYDWREHETRINRLPQFRTSVDGQTIHFVHARGRGPKPMPLLLNHGWPWTFWDYQKVIGPLSDTPRHSAVTRRTPSTSSCRRCRVMPFRRRWRAPASTSGAPPTCGCR